MSKKNDSQKQQTLPGPRAESASPRAFAEDVPPSATAVAADGTPALPKPPADILAQSPHTALPAKRHVERPVPALTPAVYQTEPAKADAPRGRATLPAKRAEDEAPRLKVRADVSAPPAPPASSAAEALSAPKAPEAARRHVTSDRMPKFKPFEVEPADPERSNRWGTTGTDARPARGRFLIIGLLAVALGGVVAWFSLKAPRAAGDITAPEETYDSSQGVEKARATEAVIEKFLSADTVEARAAWVRHPEATRPRMEAWHADGRPLRPLTLEKFLPRANESTVDGSSFIIRSVEIKGQGVKAIAVEETPEGLRVDWESFAFWADPPWAEFLATTPETAADYRVSVAPDDYFNHAYADSEKFFCFKLIDPENQEHVWGYCPLDSEIGQALNSLVRRYRRAGTRRPKAILRLRFEEAGRNHKQVLIESVVQDGWILP